MTKTHYVKMIALLCSLALGALFIPDMNGAFLSALGACTVIVGIISACDLYWERKPIRLPAPGKKRKNPYYPVMGLFVVVIMAAMGGHQLGETATAKGNSHIKLFERRDRLKQDCASSLTYGRLKEIVFDQASRIPEADLVNMPVLAQHSMLRMENPRVKSRDEEMETTVCTGRLVLHLPLGSERGFGGANQFAADVEYTVQAAADKSGTVYQISGAEPVVYRLAAFDLRRGQPAQGSSSAQMSVSLRVVEPTSNVQAPDNPQ